MSPGLSEALLNRYFEYSGENARHTSFPLGGIGTGSIGIGADGRLRDWEIFNRPSKGSVNGFSHFAIRAERSGGGTDVRVLNGPFMGNRTGEIDADVYNSFGFGPRREEMAGFPAFEESSLTGPYPVASLHFSDRRFPGNIALSALSPFVPMEDRLSSMPVAMFEFTITNPSDADIDYSLFGCLAFPFENADVSVSHGNDIAIVSGKSSANRQSVEYGELCIACDQHETSHQRHLFRGSWFDMLEVYWQDISRGGPLKDRFYAPDFRAWEGGPKAPKEHSVLACHFRVNAGESRSIRYLISWFVPNMTKYWNSSSSPQCCDQGAPEVWSNYYATQWKSSVEVALEAFDRWDEACDGTRRLQDILRNATLPVSVTDAVTSTMSVVKTATALRLQDGTFYGWEGCHPHSGCCEGSCTHVWNYQQVLPYLFPALERSMRQADFAYNQFEHTGGMTFRLALPLGSGIGSSRPCADGQFGNVMKTYRDWKLSGQTDWLIDIWPSVKAAIEYAWHPDNCDRWDPGKSGVLSGRQHHTLDMELFGPNAWLTGFYLGALLAGSEMARAVGDGEAAQEYAALFRKGKETVANTLFNGEYFVQETELSEKSILESFAQDHFESAQDNADIEDIYWSPEHGQIKYQIGEGCEIDQVLAEWHARLYGLGPIFDPDQFSSAVRAIYRHNFRRRLGDHPNPCRVFGMIDESGTVMCAWPSGAVRPSIPVPYSQETMHGFEYAFGCQLMMIGEIEKGIEVFAAVRDRYRGHNRNPWNEIECGSNYARSMSSFAALLVLSGFGADGTRKTMQFAPLIQRDDEFRGLWSNGQAWGEVRIRPGALKLSVEGGRLILRELRIGNTCLDAAQLSAGGAGELSGGLVELESGSIINLEDDTISLSGTYNFCRN